MGEALEAKFLAEGAALAAQFDKETNVDRLRFLHRQGVLAQSPEDFLERITTT